MPDKKKQEVRETDEVGFSHQFNNLLTAILSNICMAKLDSPPESEQYKILVEAEEAAIEARELIKKFDNQNKPSATTTCRSNKSTENAISDRRRILVVDDDKRAGTAMGRMLEHLGHRSDFVRDCTAAIELYKTSKRGFDLVFLDLLIPGSDGAAETLQELRKLDSKVKTILVSGHLNDPMMANYKKFGFDGAISKPYRLNELESALNRAFSKTIPK